MSLEKLTQFRNQLFDLQAAYSNHLPEGVTARPPEGAERSQKSFRTKKN